MQKHPILILLFLLSACATPRQGSANYASTCVDAEARGAIYLAEANCEQAWQLVKSEKSKSNFQSQLLYDLARIKRQLSKFKEAEKYIQQSLVLEESISGANSTAYALRLLELSLSIAGQGDYSKAALILEPVLKVADQFTSKDKKQTVNVLKNFASRIATTNSQLAERFTAKIHDLQ